MRCKKHYTDLSSTVGVCACCLRERLFSLIAAQEQALAHVQNLDGKHRYLDDNPAFPRSVSPFTNGRKSNNLSGASEWSDKDQHPPAAPRHHHSLSDQLSYRTPQVGPTTGDHKTVISGHSNKKKNFIRLFPFPNIFRSRNRNLVDSTSDSTFRESYSDGNATSSPSWLSSIIFGGRHRRKQTVCIDESTVTAASGPLRRHYCRDQGMSPVRKSDFAGVDEDELCNAANGNESTESWKNTPRRTPLRRGGGGAHGRNLSGLTFCLSPLVRASPNRQWNQKGLPPDVVLSGEIRAPVKPHISNTKIFCANKSRKVADFGRPNQNHRFR